MGTMDALDEREEEDDFQEIVVSEGEFQERCIDLIDKILERGGMSWSRATINPSRA